MQTPDPVKAGQPTPADPIEAAVRTSRAARMTGHEVGYMLAAATRLPDVFAAAQTHLTADLFDRSEAAYVLVWRAALAAALAAGGALPADPQVAREQVAVRCSAEIATDTTGQYYTPKIEGDVLDPGGLLDEVFALPVDHTVSTTGFDLLVRFVSERRIADPLRQALAGLTTRDTLKDPIALITAIEGHARNLAGIGSDPASDAVVDADDFVVPGAVVYSTRMKWLDACMGGGQARRETYVVLASTGGGKTAMGVQLSVEGSEFEAAMAADIGSDEAGYWYYFTYELDQHQLRERVYSYGARVHHQTLNERDPRTRRPVLSTAADPTTLKAYETEPYVNSPGNPVMGETERVAAFRRRQAGRNNRLVIVDYSGAVPGQGVGGVTEAASFLRRQAARGRRVAGFVIDYAGLAVLREISAKNWRPEVEYQLLAGFVDKVRNQISIPFDCSGWVLHQLHGESTKRSPGVRIHHSEARGCRNFADNSDFAHCLGVYNRSTGLMNVWTTKSRRAQGREDGTVVQFDGRFGAFRDPDQAYVIDPMTRQIVPRGYLDALPVPTPAYGGPGGGSTPPADPRIGL